MILAKWKRYRAPGEALGSATSSGQFRSTNTGNSSSSYFFGKGLEVISKGVQVAVILEGVLLAVLVFVGAAMLEIFKGVVTLLNLRVGALIVVEIYVRAVTNTMVTR